MDGLPGLDLHAIEKKRPQGKPTPKKLRQLVEYQDYKCAVSGLELEPNTASADHIIPVSKNGQNDMCNIAIVHKEVNRMKGALHMNDFIEWCRIICKNVEFNAKLDN